MQTSIEANHNQLKIVADHTLVVGLSDFYTFNFTEFSNFKWVQAIPELKDKVLYQIGMTDDKFGDFILTNEEAKLVGNWLWHIAIKAFNNGEILGMSIKNFEYASESGKSTKFDFPIHFHRMKNSALK